MTRALVLLLALPLGAAQAAPVTLVFDGDVRGVLGGSRGGVARTHAELQRRRALDPELVLVSTGGVLGPSPVSEVDGGAAMVDLMNQARYEVMALGRKDLFAGKENALQRLAAARFPVLASNLRLAATASRLQPAWDRLRTWHRVTRSGQGFVFYGVLSAAATGYGAAWDPEIEVQPLVPSLRAARAAASSSASGEADRHVVLGTMGFRDAVSLLKELPWVDLVIANKIGVDEFLDDESFEYRLRDGRAVVWTEVFGRSLGEARFPASGPAALSSVRLPEGAPQAEAAVVQVAAARARADVELSGLVGTTSPEERADFPQAVVEALRVEMGAEVGVLHAGSVLTDLAVPERLTRKDLREAYPYTDHGAFLELSGRALRQLWATRDSSEEPGRHLLFAGVEQRGPLVLVNGRLLDDDDRYRVATVDFLTQGGFGPLLEGQGRVLEARSVDLLEAYFARPDRAGVRRQLGSRPIVRRRTKMDFSQSRVDFDGSAAAYQYQEPNTTYTGSDIPGLVGLPHSKVDLILDHKLTVERVQRDEVYRLRLAFSEFSPNFNALKTVDQLGFSTRWEQKAPGKAGPRWFGSFDLASALRNPALPGKERPLFLRGVAGLQWARGSGTKLYAGLGRIARRATPGDPASFGLNLGYSHTRSWDQGRLTWSSELDGFASGDSHQVRTFQATNELRARVTGPLSTVLRHTLFLWRDSSLHRSANREDTFVGLGFDLDRRRY